MPTMLPSLRNFCAGSSWITRRTKQVRTLFGWQLHNGEVVAQLGFIPFMGIAPDGTVFKGAYPVNLMARPKFRSTGTSVIGETG
jgi:hypothetical protein